MQAILIKESALYIGFFLTSLNKQIKQPIIGLGLYLKGRGRHFQWIEIWLRPLYLFDLSLF